MSRDALRNIALWAAGVLVAVAAVPARGEPNWGAGCGQSGCHTRSRNGVSLQGYDEVANLGAGSLKTFRAVPGDRLVIGFNVTDGHNKYALVVADLDEPGIQQGETFSSTVHAGSEWNDRTSYWRSDQHSSSRSYTFELTVDSATGSDAFRIDSKMAGKNGGQWVDEEDFYLQIVTDPIPGDANLDGSVDMLDYVAARDHYGASTGAGRRDGDTDGDGDVDWRDYLALKEHFDGLFAPAAAQGAAVPEPTALAMLALGGAAVLRRRRKRSRLG